MHIQFWEQKPVLLKCILKWSFMNIFCPFFRCKNLSRTIWNRSCSFLFTYPVLAGLRYKVVTTVFFLFADCKNECAKLCDFWVYTNDSAWDWERKIHRGIEQTKGSSLSFFVLIGQSSLYTVAVVFTLIVHGDGSKLLYYLCSCTMCGL